MEDVVLKTLKVLREKELIPEYEKHEERITEVLKEVAQKEATLSTKMCPMIDNIDLQKVEEAMSELIGQDRVDDIKMAFSIESYSMTVNSEDNQSVQVSRNGVQFQPERMLKTIVDIETATVLLLAGIVIELFFFLLGCVGIIVRLNQAEMRALVEEVEVIVKQSAVREALNAFLADWNKAECTTWEKAKAIFYFLQERYSLGTFWEIIKLIFKDMCKWEKIKAMVEVVMMIVAAFTTERFALIARIALAVRSCNYLKSKTENIIMLSDMKKTMKYY